jgi:hypothetical protein
MPVRIWRYFQAREKMLSLLATSLKCLMRTNINIYSSLLIEHPDESIWKSGPLKAIIMLLPFGNLDEPPCADPHAGCCRGWGRKAPGYPIKQLLFTNT